MEHVARRRSGVRGMVCALLVLGAALAGQGRAEAKIVGELPAPAAIDLAATDAFPGVVVYPARGVGPRPITVVLHGMCGEPSRTCAHFADEVTRTGHLICPRAAQPCAGGGASWPTTGFAEAVERAVARAETVLGEAPDESHGRTLIGYSLGAYRALEIAQNASGKYPRVMLIGAKVFPNRKLLADNGVERLLLSAGSWDMMHDHMQEETERARRAGVTARFLGLGPVGHAFTPSFARYLPEALAWLSGG